MTPDDTIRTMHNDLADLGKQRVPEGTCEIEIQQLDPVTTRARGLFLGAAAVAVAAGGFVAAAGGVAPSRHLSWATAYLVLVWGLCQAVLGVGQFIVAPRASPPLRLVTWQFISFNLGNAGVLVGTLAGSTFGLDAGSAVFLVALGLFAWATRHVAGGRRMAILVYRAVLIVLVASVPAGVVLAH